MEKKDIILIVESFNEALKDDLFYEEVIEQLGPDEFLNLINQMNDLLFLKRKTGKKYIQGIRDMD